MARRRISIDEGLAAVRMVAQSVQDVAGGGVDVPLGGVDVPRETIATATRFLLEELAERAPGNSLEVRVPPYGATQCMQGPRHTRGTPPNVVEMNPETWLAVATGHLDWSRAIAEARVTVSGTRTDLSPLLPIVRLGAEHGERGELGTALDTAG